MPTSNNPRHGEPIANVRQSNLPGGGLQSFPTRQFQEFIDELSAFNNETDVTKLEQKLSILQSATASSVGAVRASYESEISRINQIIHSLISENARLKALVAQFSPLNFIDIGSSGTAHTTGGNELIACNNASEATITLNPNPKEGEVVKIKRLLFTVVVSSLLLVDGETEYTISEGSEGLDLIYTLSNGWLII